MSTRSDCNHTSKLMCFMKSIRNSKRKIDLP
jgi:hypothetical protein